MAMKAILARDTGNDYLVRVHLDDTKLVDGQPDPDWIAEWRFGKAPPAGVSAANYRTALRNEVRALAQAELAKRQAAATPDPGGSALPFEGQEI